jgi:protein-S-isoprenylcysteine O-methyltransferase Ste14
MDTHVTSRDHRDAGLVGAFPAYGPVEAVLGYAMFYVFVDRATPAVVEVFSETVLDLSPSFVGFGLAAALWFVLVLTVVDQVRRQLAALGLGSYDEYQLRVWSRVTPASLRAAGYLLAFGAGTVVAGLTFERAVDALLSLIPVVATVDVAAVDVVGLVVLVVFSVSYSAATHSLDRLVVDGIRTLASG